MLFFNLSFTPGDEKKDQFQQNFKKSAKKSRKKAALIIFIKKFIF